MTDNDKLAQRQKDLVNAIRDWRSKWKLLQERIQQLAANALNQAERAAVVDEALGEPTARITLCSEAILQLTDDKRTEALVCKLDGLISAEVGFWRSAANVGAAIPDAVKNTPVYQVLGRLVSAFLIPPAAMRHKELVATMAEAEAYFSAA
jgi:hypothetical protein